LALVESFNVDTSRLLCANSGYQATFLILTATRKESPNNLTFAQAETDELYAVRWAELPSSTDLQVEAFGFPDAEFFYGPGAPTTRTYDTRKIAGKVFGGANLIADHSRDWKRHCSSGLSCAEQPGALAGDFGRRGL
jgi:hypothetical protein